MVADRERLDAGPDRLDDARALVAENRRKEAFRIVAREREGVRVAHARRREPHEALALLRPLELDHVDLQGLPGFDGDGSFDLHLLDPPAVPGDYRTQITLN